MSSSSPQPTTQLSVASQERRWIVADRTEETIVGQLLRNRSIADADRFFHPSYERDSYDPDLLPDMTKSVDRILEAIQSREPIAVYADYDADGIPGGALLVKVLRMNGATVVPYIPDRELEGYGLNEPALRALKNHGVRLVITVDLGITNSVQVTAARALGLEVIVTDHHHVDPERIPLDALGRVHPAMLGSNYPFPGLAGGGVAWKMAQAIARRTGLPTEPALKWLIDLPTISTVCDMVPLRDENRMIVSFGLQVLKKTRSVGLRALYQAGAIDPASITERSVGFQIGPRINAPGRVDHANGALELLLTEDAARARDLAATIEGQNRLRQTELERIVVEASQQVHSLGNEVPVALVLAGRQWPTGLLGLAASRIVERFHRPTILLGVTPDGLAKGSGRGIEAFNLLEGIHAQRELLTSYGGHERAAGLAMPGTAVSLFSERFLSYATSILTADALLPTHRADMVLSPHELSDALVDTVARFAPFGVGNREPTFIIRPLTIDAVQTMGAERQHVKFRFRGLNISAIAFRAADRFASLVPGSTVELLGTLKWNNWNGRRSIDCLIADLRPWNGS